MQILSELFQPEPAPGVAGLFLEGGGVAESSHRGVARFFRAHACPEILGDLLVKMELDFVV